MKARAFNFVQPSHSRVGQEQGVGELAGASGTGRGLGLGLRRVWEGACRVAGLKVGKRD